MSMHRTCTWVLAGILGILSGMATGCNSDPHETHTRFIQAETIVFELPRAFGAPQRPLVEFPHDRHTRVLQKEGCKTCHPLDAKGRSLPRLLLASVPSDMDELMEAYHDACLTCHQKRAAKDPVTGPVECGACHVPRPPTQSTRQAIRFDYSLHHRHVRASKDRCSTCHHSYNQQTGKLQHKPGTESNCRDCHADRDKKKILSLRDAAHLDCINCHLQSKEKNEAYGPWLCEGCHSKTGQARIKKLAEVPRLKRMQPDVVWIKKDPAAGARLVAFDHLYHEANTVTSACHDCHHQTMQPCQDCHTLTGSPAGAGVTLEQAFHSATSRFSCVGCHDQAAKKDECAGCHHLLTRPPGRGSCNTCHLGPLPRLQETVKPESLTAEIQMDALPPVSEDFPEQIEIRAIASKYAPSKFPHRKIVAKLDQAIRKNKLAVRFHGKTEVMCSGCHHHSPPEQRYPPCRSCHSGRPHPTRDLPDLQAAYHRQCMGCHQQIGHEALGCEDCHKENPQEVRP